MKQKETIKLPDLTQKKHRKDLLEDGVYPTRMVYVLRTMKGMYLRGGGCKRGKAELVPRFWQARVFNQRNQASRALTYYRSMDQSLHICSCTVRLNDI